MSEQIDGISFEEVILSVMVSSAIQSLIKPEELVVLFKKLDKEIDNSSLPNGESGEEAAKTLKLLKQLFQLDAETIITIGSIDTLLDDENVSLSDTLPNLEEKRDLLKEKSQEALDELLKSFRYILHNFRELDLKLTSAAASVIIHDLEKHTIKDANTAASILGKLWGKLYKIPLRRPEHSMNDYKLSVILDRVTILINYLIILVTLNQGISLEDEEIEKSFPGKSTLEGNLGWLDPEVFVVIRTIVLNAFQYLESNPELDQDIRVIVESGLYEVDFIKSLLADGEGSDEDGVTVVASSLSESINLFDVHRVVKISNVIKPDDIDKFMSVVRDYIANPGDAESNSGGLRLGFVMVRDNVGSETFLSGIIVRCNRNAGTTDIFLSIPEKGTSQN